MRITTSASIRSFVQIPTSSSMMPSIHLMNTKPSTSGDILHMIIRYGLLYRWGAKRWSWFDHDPTHDDEFVDGLGRVCKKNLWQAGSTMKILGAKEGMSLSLD